MLKSSKRTKTNIQNEEMFPNFKPVAFDETLLTLIGIQTPIEISQMHIPQGGLLCKKMADLLRHFNCVGNLPLD